MSREYYFRMKGVIVGAAFILVGLGIALTEGRQWLTGYQSRNWVSVEAMVVVSRQVMAEYSGSDGQVHSIPELHFLYRYQVEGLDYESDRLSYSVKEVAVSDQQAFMERYPEGKSLTVFYNPKKPSQAVLERGVPMPGILMIVLPGLFALLGPFIIWGSITGAIVRFCEKHGLHYR